MKGAIFVNAGKKIGPIEILFIVMGLFTFIKFFQIIYTDGAILRDYIWEFDTSFRDYYDHVRRALEPGNVYAKGADACFPPLACLFYEVIACFCRVDNSPDRLSDLSSSTSYILSLIIVEGITWLLLGLGIRECVINRMNSARANILAFLLVLSNVSLMALTSGNVAFLMADFVLVAYILKDSKNKIYREIALVLIACAFSFKIYPCVMGALYLREKRFKEIGRLIVYALLLFFVPFVFFDGINGLNMWFKNISTIAGNVTGITIIGICRSIFSHFMSFNLASLCARIVDLIYLITILILILSDKRRLSWKVYLFVSSMMIIVNTEAGSYCLSYLILAFTAFIRYILEKKQYKLMDYIYAALFALFYTMIPVPQLGGAAMMPTLIMYVIIGTAVIEECIEIVKNKKIFRTDMV